MKVCKTCGKELVGKEKLFCKNCRSKGVDVAKKSVLAVGGVALMAVALITKSDKVADVIKGISKDI